MEYLFDAVFGGKTFVFWSSPDVLFAVLIVPQDKNKIPTNKMKILIISKFFWFIKNNKIQFVFIGCALNLLTVPADFKNNFSCS